MDSKDMSCDASGGGGDGGCTAVDIEQFEALAADGAWYDASILKRLEVEVSDRRSERESISHTYVYYIGDARILNLVELCPHTIISLASSYCYICVLILYYII